jgi:hypothetical protein
VLIIRGDAMTSTEADRFNELAMQLNSLVSSQDEGLYIANVTLCNPEAMSMTYLMPMIVAASSIEQANERAEVLVTRFPEYLPPSVSDWKILSINLHTISSDTYSYSVLEQHFSRKHQDYFNNPQ